MGRVNEKKIPVDMHNSWDKICESLGWKLSDWKAESDNAEYGACEFLINEWRIKFRSGKITPKKVGQFVTFWKRSEKGPIRPFNREDPFDFLIVRVEDDPFQGYFVFPKHSLCEKGVVTSLGKEGKRAMRLYPPWIKASSLNPQAIKTQRWQSEYFISFSTSLEIICTQFGVIFENKKRS